MDSFQNSLINIKEFLNDVIILDKADNSVETKLRIYQKYVQCIKQIFTVLDDDLKTYSSIDSFETSKYIQSNHMEILITARNTIDRLIDIMPRDNIRKISSQPNSLNTENYFDSNALNLRSLSTRTSIDMILAEKPVPPMVSAKMNIQKLIDSTNALLKSNKLSSAERTAIQLRISRQIEESLSIAKKHEDNLYKVQADSLELLNEKLDNDVNKYPFLRNNEDFESLYRASQSFFHHILKDSRTYHFVQSSQNPESSCLSFILKMNNVHPVAAYIKRQIDKILSIPIHTDNDSKFLESIEQLKDKMDNLSKLCCLIINIRLTDNMMVVAPKLLDIIYGFIFEDKKLGTHTYNFLFSIYKENMQQYMKNLKFLEENHNYQILLPEKFKPHEDIIDILNKQSEGLTALRQSLNPLEKITILSKLITDLMSKIQNQNSKLEIGADELVPILVYMTIQSNSPELFFHGKYLELLIPNCYLAGIEGYLLVSILCAITFCVSEDFPLLVCKS